MRVSVIKLSWTEAEQKCKSEGGHLLSINNENVQFQVNQLINDKIEKKEKEFQAPYATDTENFWLGGTVRHPDEWKWISTLESMSAYNNWKNGKEGSGCAPSGPCQDTQRVLMKGPKYEWSADDQAKEYPYICESGCAVGYIWQKTAKKCVKIVRKDGDKRSHSQASLFCAKENARLLTLSSCEEFKGLVKDLKFFWHSSAEQYWVGLYISHPTFSRSRGRSTDSAGRASVEPGTDTDCSADNRKVKMVDAEDNDVALDTDSEYYGLLSYFDDTSNKPSIQLHKYGVTDQSAENMFLCEKEIDWECSEGYILFREHCYKYFAEYLTSTEAELSCSEEGGKVLELESLVTLNFLSAWLGDHDNPPQDIWLGYQRHIYTRNISHNMDYVAFDGLSEFNTNKFAISGSDTEGNDCLVMKQNAGSFSTFAQLSCKSSVQYVCQKEQEAAKSKVAVIPEPQVLLPLDKTSGYQTVSEDKTENNQTLVAITEQSTPSGLIGSGDFLKNFQSNIEIGKSVSVKFGVTILVWAKIKTEIEENKKIFIFDGSQTEGDKSFQLFIENKASKNILGVQLCNSDSSCFIFYSPSDISLELRTWHMIGFTFSTDDMKGSFIINNTFGYSDTKSFESSYFFYDTKAWLHTGALKSSIMIGSEKGSQEGLGGEFSCFQVYEMFFTPSQVRQVQKCPLPEDYKRYSDCPEGFILYKDTCYNVSKEEKAFSDSEYECSSEPGSPILTSLAFPPDFRSQEYLSDLLNTFQYNVSQVWVGLGMRSEPCKDSASWTRSDGMQLNELLWANGQPDNKEEKQCVFMASENNG